MDTILYRLLAWCSAKNCPFYFFQSALHRKMSPYFYAPFGYHDLFAQTNLSFIRRSSTLNTLPPILHKIQDSIYFLQPTGSRLYYVISKCRYGEW